MSLAGLCRREGVAKNLIYTCSKEFMETNMRRIGENDTEIAVFHDMKSADRDLFSQIIYLAPHFVADSLFVIAPDCR